MLKKTFYRKALASFSVECDEFLRFLAEPFFQRFHWVSYKKETAVYGFEPLQSACQQLPIPLRHLSLTLMIFPLNLRGVEISGVNICKICNFSGEKFFSPHSAGSGEKFSFTA